LPGVFVLNDTNTLVSLEPAHFASEDDFQVLLAKFPELLAGDQIDPSNPRRWLLARVESSDAADNGRLRHGTKVVRTSVRARMLHAREGASWSFWSPTWH
jgi:hypothetical protein